MFQGFGLRGYRSFSGTELQRVSPIGPIHFLAGINNSGKSSLLAAAQTYLPILRTLPASSAEIPRPSGLDIPAGAHEPFRLAVAFDDIESRLEDLDGLDEDQRNGLAAWLEAPSFRPTEDGLIWIQLAPEAGTAVANALPIDPLQLSAVESEANIAPEIIGRASLALTGQGGGSRWSDAIRVISALTPLRDIPPVVTVQALRRIENMHEGRPSEDPTNGVGLIRAVARLKDPAVGRDDDLVRFENINDFVKIVVDDDSASLSVTSDSAEIVIRRAERPALPLDSFGTGLHQAIILAAAATVTSDHLVCLEEPELNLHPLLQRQLIQYLVSKTSNRYMIATHSAHLLDSVAPRITHVELRNHVSSAGRVTNPTHLFRVATELGYRASDLVQSNCVIWVEGPSDRVYLRHWLKQWDDELIEGLHFTIMFYGGSLLKDLTPDDPDVDDFISLRRINRNLAILIDSDKRSPHARLNGTKRRVIEGMSADVSDAVWVTSGYTIENYIPWELLTSAVTLVHPTARLGAQPGRYGNPLALSSLNHSASFSPNKARIARCVVERWPGITGWNPHLRERVAGFAAFIRRANDLPARLTASPTVVDADGPRR